MTVESTIVYPQLGIRDEIEEEIIQNESDKKFYEDIVVSDIDYIDVDCDLHSNNRYPLGRRDKNGDKLD